MERRQMGMEGSDRRGGGERKARNECRERGSQNGGRESALDRQSKFEREEVTEEKIQTKEEEG